MTDDAFNPFIFSLKKILPPVWALLSHMSSSYKRNFREWRTINEGEHQQLYSPGCHTSPHPDLYLSRLSVENVRCSPQNSSQHRGEKRCQLLSCCCKSLMDTPTLQVCAKITEGRMQADPSWESC